jgi:hypothetical protein
LAFVHDLYDDPKISFFGDPWRLSLNGSLDLHIVEKWNNTAHFEATDDAYYVRRVLGGKERRKLEESYTYLPLGHRQIRLIRLEPGSGDAPLEGSIEHVSVDSPGKFSAISYAWGIADYSQALTTPTGPIIITMSLFSVLKEIREKGDRPLLWVDAVCIDQENSDEKVTQIRLMRTIYSKAFDVVAWLGHEEHNSSQVIKTLCELRSLSQKPDSLITGVSTPVSLSWRNLKIPDPEDNIWAYTNRFLSRTWFQRVWIVQELVLPSKVVLMCGSSTLDWEDLIEALAICERELFATNPEVSTLRLMPSAAPAYRLEETRQLYHGQTSRCGLLELLQKFSHTQATNPYDRLFGLLGLAYDVDHSEFDPDYDSSLQDVVERYASRLVRQNSVLDLLYISGTSKSAGYTSWIPDWFKNPFPETISTWKSADGEFIAGLGTLPVANLITNSASDSPILEITGYLVDVIDIISPVRMGDSTSIPFMDTLDDFRKLISFVKLPYPTNETHEQLLLKLPIGNSKGPEIYSSNSPLQQRRELVGLKEVESWPEDLQQMISSYTVNQDRSRQQEKPTRTRTFVEKYWQTSRNFAKRITYPKFCTTKRGYIGLVPGDAKKEDLICLFHGSKVPFIVQRRIHRIGYRLVGECYIHGIMRGEALARNLQETSFQLF